MISFFKFERLKKSLSNDQMEFFRKECELTLAEGDKKVQFEQAVTTLVANTLNPNKNSCKYSAGCTSQNIDQLNKDLIAYGMLQFLKYTQVLKYLFKNTFSSNLLFQENFYLCRSGLLCFYYVIITVTILSQGHLRQTIFILCRCGAVVFSQGCIGVPDC